MQAKTKSRYACRTTSEMPLPGGKEWAEEELLARRLDPRLSWAVATVSDRHLIVGVVRVAVPVPLRQVAELMGLIVTDTGAEGSSVLAAGLTGDGHRIGFVLVGHPAGQTRVVTAGIPRSRDCGPEVTARLVQRAHTLEAFRRAGFRVWEIAREADPDVADAIRIVDFLKHDSLAVGW